VHICVCVKQTPDSASVYIDPLSGQIDVERFVQVLNAADACALEAAMQLKEQPDDRVTAITLGPPDAGGALRAALAMGADNVLRLWHPAADLWSAITIAAALAAAIHTLQPWPDLVLCGDASSDWGSGTVGPALAEYLALPQVSGVVQLAATRQPAQAMLLVSRQLERGYREKLEVLLPALITVTSTLNEPRYPSLPAHLAALRAPIPVLDLSTLPGLALPEETTRTTVLEIHTPRPLPRRISAPDSSHSAYQRIGEIISGGATGRNTRLIEGSSEELAQTLLTFLKEKGFI
jgi:electron transfer flavoprotein beta subunit